MEARRLALLLTLLALGSATPARAQEVGEVTRTVKARGTLGERTWALAEKEPVRTGLTVSLIPRDSLIDVHFDVPVSVSDRAGGAPLRNSFHAEGPDGELTIEEARREEGTGKLLLGLKLPRGSLWMTLSQLVLHQVWIQTPQLKALPLGTTFRMLVDPVVGTFLATDAGAVRAELTSGEVLLVTAGHWLLVPPAGAIQRGAGEVVRDGLEDPPLLDCCDFRTGPPFCP
jgi:hypothetical protein